jgi:hypothetical protein
MGTPAVNVLVLVSSEMTVESAQLIRGISGGALIDSPHWEFQRERETEHAGKPNALVRGWRRPLPDLAPGS